MKLNPTFQYSTPGDNQGQIIGELAKILGILLGIGATPFLGEWTQDWFWVVGLAAGLITFGVGFFYAVRQAPVRKRGSALVTRGAAFLRRQFAWLKTKVLFWRERPVEAEELTPVPTARPQDEPHQADEPWILWPLFTMGIGLFIAVPAIVAGLTGSQDIAMYFSTPAILLWIAGEGFYFYPYFIVKPKRTPEIAAMLRSSLQVLSALLLWVFLGLAAGMAGISWMIGLGAGLAVAGLILGLVAAAGRPPPAATAQARRA